MLQCPPALTVDVDAKLVLPVEAAVEVASVNGLGEEVGKFGSWTKALKHAGLEPAGRKCGWESDDIARALRTWTEEHGRPPKNVDWRRATQTHPSDVTVRAHFGTWERALAAAAVRDIDRRSKGAR